MSINKTNCNLKAGRQQSGTAIHKLEGWKEMFLFNDALNTIYLRLYGGG